MTEREANARLMEHYTSPDKVAARILAMLAPEERTPAALLEAVRKLHADDLRAWREARLAITTSEWESETLAALLTSEVTPPPDPVSLTPESVAITPTCEGNEDSRK